MVRRVEEVDSAAGMGVAEYAYDAAGNLTTDKDGYTYEYDYENRITKIVKSGPTTVAEFAYDALGRRIRKIDSIAGETTVYYHNDKWQVVCEYDGGGDFQRWYAYGNYIDEVLFTSTTTSPFAYKYYVQDHLYSPVALLYWNGSTAVERYEYDAYGNCHVLEPNYAPDADGLTDYENPWFFTGREVDLLDSGSLKIQYNRNRYYDQYTGRFTTHDPLGYVDGMNLYEYADGNPCREVDPEGLRVWRAWDECTALKALHDQIAEWRLKGYNFAADLMEYFSHHGGPVDYVPTTDNIEEVKKHGTDRILDVIYNETLSMRARHKSVGVPIGTMWDVSITHPGRGSDASSNIRWWYHSDNKNMLYAYGGADLDASGKVYIFEERDRWNVPWQWSGRVNIGLGDEYTFDVGAVKENVSAAWSPAYDAALWLQTTCDYDPFYHRMQFRLKWDWLDPPDAWRDDYPQGIY